MNLSVESGVDTTDVDLTKSKAALVDTENADTTRDGIKLSTFNHKRN